ncbi:MAG: TatD family hydrolase [Bacteroidia bacterium]|nr:TatD family hydrolase [Bacteroidia bacterium]
MNFPEPGDYIDIHNHGANAVPGIFTIETLMAHENREPENIKGLTYSFGIHPWHLDENSHDHLISCVIINAVNPDVALIGEAGFDRIKGPSLELQRKTFEEQVKIAKEHKKPMVIHCVRAWDDLLQEHKKLKPQMPWLVHGFRGKPDLAQQLVSKGMYISFWFDFVMKPEAIPLLKSVPKERFFLETDGAGINIMDIYNKVSDDLDISVEELKRTMFLNFNQFFKGIP